MPKTLTDFDPAPYLDTPEARAAFIADMLAEGYDGDLREALAIVARAQGMERVADAANVSRAGIYKALGEDGDPRFTTMRGILDALGLRLSVEVK